MAASIAVSNNSKTDGLDNLLTKEDVECVVEKSLGSKVTILRYHLKSYSNEKLGLMGAHWNLVIEVSRDGSQTEEIHMYFVKTIPHNMEAQAKFLKDSGIFRRETSFYNGIMPELIKTSKDNSWAPRCFLAKDDALVLEHLKLKGYALKGKFLDVASLKAGLSSLAKMHAASMLAEERLGETFLDVCPELTSELLFFLGGPFTEWFKSGVLIATRVAEKLGINYEIVPKACNSILEKFLPSKTRRNVICHGDTWSNNFMFNDSNCALVDFQLMRYVPPMVDVAQMIYFNAKKELRDECEMQLLESYYDVLRETLTSGGMDCPSFMDILGEYEEMKIVGIVSINLYFPVTHTNDAKINEVMKDSEGFQDLYCKDRSIFVLEGMEKDQRYRELITSIVRELVDMAEALFK